MSPSFTVAEKSTPTQTDLVGFSSSYTTLKVPSRIDLQAFSLVFGGELSSLSYRTSSSRTLRWWR